MRLIERGRQAADTGVAAGTASASIGSVIAATLGAACCSGPFLGPLIVAVLGASGAVALAGIKPYTPYLFGISLVMLAVSFWSVYRPGQQCTVTSGGRIIAHRPIKVMLWIAAAVWVVSVGFTVISLTKS